MLSIHAWASIFSLMERLYHHRVPGLTIRQVSASKLKAPAACTDLHEDNLAPSSIEKKLAIEGIRDASQNQYLKHLPDHGVQRTPECARRKDLGCENLNLSSSIASDSRQPMMTVEDFLKRSNGGKGVVKKQYGKTKTRIRRLGNNGALLETERQHEIFGPDSEDASQNIIQLRSKKIRRATIYESSGDDDLALTHEESSPLKTKIKKTRGRIHKPLKERLYEAVVLTHGHPDDLLVHEAANGSELAPTRRPLHFIPDTQPDLDDAQIDKRRPRTWSLVDPRKSTAIRTATFSSKIRPCLPHTDSPSGKTANLSVPPRRWKFADASLAHSSLSRQKSNKQCTDNLKIPAVKAADKYPPLVFVSLEEAEEDYKSMFSYDNYKRNSRLLDVCTAPTLQLVSVADTLSHIEGRISSDQTVPTCNMQVTPLEDVIQRPNFAMEASAQVAVDQIRTVDNLNDFQSAPLHPSPFINSIRLPTTSVLPVTPQSAQDWQTSKIVLARHGSSRANVRERPLIRRSSDVSPKPMRPLASFFNEFIQNIRNVAVSQGQPSVSDKHLVSKRPLRKVSMCEHNPRQSEIDAMLLRPAAANPTDTNEGIFVPQQTWTNDWESIRQTDRDHMNLPSNQHLSPDTLVVCEPQNYQVILSSPS